MATGEIRPRIWWLGKDEQRAQQLARLITDEWDKLRALGITEWTDDAMGRIEASRQGGDAAAVSEGHAAAQDRSTQQNSTGTQHTSHQAIDLFSTHYKSDQGRAQNTKTVMGWRLAMLKSVVANVAMSAFTPREIQKVVDHYKSLPVAPKTGKRISPTTAQEMIKVFKAFLDYCDRQNIWTAPRRFDDLFKTKLKKKSNGNHVETFDIFELKELWDAANESQRLYLLLMLNCGFTSIDIAMLKYHPKRSLSDNPDDYAAGETLVFPNELFGEKGDDAAPEFEKTEGWVIAGKRTKTDIFGMFPLWDRTVALLMNVTERFNFRHP